jgi:hypothetical protein
MSEQTRQEQIDETLSLLGQMTPAALAADRDRLLFRAGEASARGEDRGPSRITRVLWPAVAAALALVAEGLGTALAMHEPDVRVVYVERPAGADVEQANAAGKTATPRDRRESDTAAESGASVYAASKTRDWPPGNGLIPSQDWAALSDAFAGQLRSQQEGSQAAQEAIATATAENRGDDTLDAAGRRRRSQTYLELRDSLRAM